MNQSQKAALGVAVKNHKKIKYILTIISLVVLTGLFSMIFASNTHAAVVSACRDADVGKQPPHCVEFTVRVTLDGNGHTVTAQPIIRGDLDGDNVGTDRPRVHSADSYTTWFRYNMIPGSNFGCEPEHHRLSDSALRNLLNSRDYPDDSYNSQKDIYKHGTGRTIDNVFAGLTSEDFNKFKSGSHRGQLTVCFQIKAANYEDTKLANAKKMVIASNSFPRDDCLIGGNRCPEFIINVTQNDRSVNAVIKNSNTDRDGDGDPYDAGDRNTFTWFRYLMVPGSRFGCESQHHTLTHSQLRALPQYNEQKNVYKYGYGSNIDDVYAGMNSQIVSDINNGRLNGQLAVCFQAKSKNRHTSNGKKLVIDPTAVSGPEFIINVTQNVQVITAEATTTRDHDGDNDPNDRADNNKFTWFRYNMIPGSNFGCEPEHHRLSDSALRNLLGSGDYPDDSYNQQKDIYKHGTGRTIHNVFAGLSKTDLDKFRNDNHDGRLAVCFRTVALNHAQTRLSNAKKLEINFNNLPNNCLLHPNTCPEFMIDVNQDDKRVTATIVDRSDRDGDGDVRDAGDAGSFTWFRYNMVPGSNFGCENEHFQLSDTALRNLLSSSDYPDDSYDQQKSIYKHGTGATITNVFAELGQTDLKKFKDGTHDGQLTVCFKAESINGENSNGKKLVLNIPNDIVTYPECQVDAGSQPATCVEFRLIVEQNNKKITAKDVENVDKDGDGDTNDLAASDSFTWFRYNMVIGSSFGCETSNHGLVGSKLKILPSAVYTQQEGIYNSGTGKTIDDVLVGLSQEDFDKFKNNSHSGKLAVCFQAKAKNHQTTNLLNNKKLIIDMSNLTQDNGNNNGDNTGNTGNTGKNNQSENKKDEEVGGKGGTGNENPNQPPKTPETGISMSITKVIILTLSIAVSFILLRLWNEKRKRLNTHL